MNDNFNYEDPEIDLGGFSVASQYHYVNFDYLDLLLHDNDDTEDFIVPTDFITTTKSRDIAGKVQERVKYGFNLSGCKILNNVGYLITRNQYDIKGSRYVNLHMQ